MYALIFSFAFLSPIHSLPSGQMLIFSLVQVHHRASDSPPNLQTNSTRPLSPIQSASHDIYLGFEFAQALSFVPAALHLGYLHVSTAGFYIPFLSSSHFVGSLDG
jgi:hypothetical protein